MDRDVGDDVRAGDHVGPLYPPQHARACISPTTPAATPGPTPAPHPSTPAARPRNLCWTCKKRGHKKDDCPTKALRFRRLPGGCTTTPRRTLEERLESPVESARRQHHSFLKVHMEAAEQAMKASAERYQYFRMALQRQESFALVDIEFIQRPGHMEAQWDYKWRA